jgi:polysaccharide deacetylase family protein (PEP-CTERM system associated)
MEDAGRAAAGDGVILSFDVEEHHRIEAASGLACPPGLQAEYAARMEAVTRRLLDRLHDRGAKATFFVVGAVARSHPALVRAIHAAGHEVASHSFDHRRVHRFTPATFRDDLLASKDALEQATGAPVVGFRAPTFSVVRQTAWAIDVLAEAGFRYDSSVFPVRHDRYGVPDAPRGPFLAVGDRAELVELPPATLRLGGLNLPVGGGGYFRLFPLGVLTAGVRQLTRGRAPAVATLYFHPWEFDPDQPRLPLSRLSRWRTYVGTRRTFGRLDRLLARYHFRRAADVAAELAGAELPRFRMGGALAATCP